MPVHAHPGIPASGQLASNQEAGAQVVKVYVLEGAAARENPGWLSVVRLGTPRALRLFVRDAKGYRAIPGAIALGMLSNADQRSLIAILRHGRGGATLREKNCIINVSPEPGPGKAGLQHVPAVAGNALVSDEIFSAGLRASVGWPYFRDHGHALDTHSNGAAVAGELVRIAHARGWQSIRVTGSEAFRRTVWAEAVTRGMLVRGYQPAVLVKPMLPRALPASGHTSPVERGAAHAGKTNGGRRLAAEIRQPGNARSISRTLDAIELQNALIYRYIMDGAPPASDPLTVYEQAVVMARIHENQQAQGLEQPSLPLGTIPVAEGIISSEPQF